MKKNIRYRFRFAGALALTFSCALLAVSCSKNGSPSGDLNFAGLGTFLNADGNPTALNSDIHQIDINHARKNYGDLLVISPMDDGVKVSKDTIILSPVEEGVEYTFSGYFCGQIVNTTKGTIIKLKDVYIENKDAKPAITSEAKLEISVAKGSENYIVSRGRSYSRNAALRSKRALVLGGGGNLYVKGKIWHGAEAEDMKIKGSGNFYFEGTRKGSALKCDSLSVEEGKGFCAYFMNSKNGIKAERTVNLASGNFYFYNDGTGIKTATSEEKPDKAHAITLTGGYFYASGVKKPYSTDEGAFTNSGAHFVEE